MFKASELESNFPIALYLGGKQGEPTVGSGVPLSIRQIDSVDKGTLRSIIVQGFNLEELDLLCADLQQILADNGIKLPVSIEMVGGNGKPQKVLNLIEYLDRRGYLPYLVRLVAGMRSNHV